MVKKFFFRKILEKFLENVFWIFFSYISTNVIGIFPEQFSHIKNILGAENSFLRKKKVCGWENILEYSNSPDIFPPELLFYALPDAKIFFWISRKSQKMLRRRKTLLVFDGFWPFSTFFLEFSNFRLFHMLFISNFLPDHGET